MDEVCKNCGEIMSGDGYSLPLHCINAHEEKWWYSEPDSGPWYCDYEGYDDDEYEMFNGKELQNKLVY